MPTPKTSGPITTLADLEVRTPPPNKPIPTLGPNLRLTGDHVEWLFQYMMAPIFFFDQSAPHKDEPRGGFVVGRGSHEGMVHISVYSNPEFDYDVSPVVPYRNVLLVHQGEEISPGTEKWALLVQVDEEPSEEIGHDPDPNSTDASNAKSD